MATRGASYRTLELDKKGQSVFGEMLGWIAEELARPDGDWYALCRDFLLRIFRGEDADYEELLNDSNLSPAVRSQVASFDARNISFEAEYYKEADSEKFNRVKPLLWMWQSFDHSPLGRNIAVGVPFRRLLAPYIFKKCGANPKFFHDVEFSFGYNISFGDDSVVHRNVLLDDRGEIVIGNHVSISDYANIYSHSHGVLDYDEVSCHRTVIGNWVRLAYHVTVMSGVKVGEDALAGAHAVIVKDVPPHHIVGGVPARTISIKKR